MNYLIILAILWFLFYWILGGAFFAIVSVFKLGRLHKLRFSCLFSIVTLAIAFGASYAGMRWANTSTHECLELARTNVEGFVGFFGCSVIALTLSFLGGAVAVIVFGAISMRLSSTRLLLPRKEPMEESKKKKEKTRNDSPLG